MSSNPPALAARQALFKQGPASSHAEAQARRREAALAAQQQRRLASISKFRQSDRAGDDEDEQVAQLALAAETSLTTVSSSSQPRSLSQAPLAHSSEGNDRGASAASSSKPYAQRLMWAELPDAAAGLPEDLATEWCALGPLPRGKRCLLVVNAPTAARQQRDSGAAPETTMTLYSRQGGKPVAIYPAGATVQASGAQSATCSARRIRIPAPRGLPPGTLLDCILPAHHSSGAPAAGAGLLFVLDLLQWGTRSFEDCDTECRRYWLAAKLREELPSFQVPAGAVLRETAPVSAPASSLGREESSASTTWTIAAAPHPFVLIPVPEAAVPLSGTATLSPGRDSIWHKLSRLQQQPGEPLHYDAGALPPPLFHDTSASASISEQDGRSMDLDGEVASPSTQPRRVALLERRSSALLVEAHGGGDDDDGTLETDGLLLYHRLACYESGTTPLALWLPPSAAQPQGR